MKVNALIARNRFDKLSRLQSSFYHTDLQNGEWVIWVDVFAGGSQGPSSGVVVHAGGRVPPPASGPFPPERSHGLRTGLDVAIHAGVGAAGAAIRNWSLTQFHSVDFFYSRIGVKK